VRRAAADVRCALGVIDFGGVARGAVRGVAVLIAIFVAWVFIRAYVYERSPAGIAASIESRRAAEAQVKERECDRAYAAGEPLPLGCAIR
jgi:hypothetical protein